MGFSSLCIYGGVPLQQQLRQIRLLFRPQQQQQQQQQQGCRKGLDAVVATPGRLIDLMGLGPSASRPGPAALECVLAAAAAAAAAAVAAAAVAAAAVAVAVLCGAEIRGLVFV